MKQLLEILGAKENQEEGFGESDSEKALIRMRYKEYRNAKENS